MRNPMVYAIRLRPLSRCSLPKSYTSPVHMSNKKKPR